MNETWQDYWKKSYLPVYVDFYDENTEEKEIFVVKTIRYGKSIDLIIENKEDILKNIHNRQKLPSLVNVGNLIGICKDYHVNDMVVNIYYKIGMAGTLNELTFDFDKVNTRSNIAEWHFIVLK